jgi:hypothetical protein
MRKRYKVLPCEYGDAMGRHRWLWRDVTQYGNLPEGGYPTAEWCQRCGQWKLDVMEEVKG